MKNFNQIFPVEIISEILSRLPAESVPESRLVCKTWKNLQPSFPELHLARLNHSDSTGKLRYIFLDTDDNVYTQPFYSEFNENDPVKPIRRMLDTGTLALDDHVLIGSFNGLLCVYGTRNKYDAMIINPVTKEYISLSEFKTKRGKSIRNEHLACGFGYLAETNEYKVVRIYRRLGNGKRYKPNVVEVHVYTVGSGKGWRHAGKFDLGFEFVINGEDRDGYEQLQGVFWNGCLHWRMLKGGMVVVFDLADEMFREPIPPPPLLTYDDEDEMGNMVLGVSNGGILYYTVCQFQRVGGEEDDEDEEKEEEVHLVEVCVWLLMRKDDDNHVMSGQEEKQPWVWSKPISLEQTEPFAFKMQDIVLRYDQGKIKEFSSQNSTWRDIGEFSEISRRVFPHKHTLISLKELGEEDVKIMKRYPELTMEDFRSMCDFDSDPELTMEDFRMCDFDSDYSYY